MYPPYAKKGALPARAIILPDGGKKAKIHPKDGTYRCPPAGLGHLWRGLFGWSFPPLGWDLRGHPQQAQPAAIHHIFRLLPAILAAPAPLPYAAFLAVPSISGAAGSPPSTTSTRERSANPALAISA